MARKDQTKMKTSAIRDSSSPRILAKSTSGLAAECGEAMAPVTARPSENARRLARRRTFAGGVDGNEDGCNAAQSNASAPRDEYGGNADHPTFLRRGRHDN